MAGFIAGIVIECVLAALIIVAMVLIGTNKLKIKTASAGEAEGVTFSSGELTFSDAYNGLSDEQREYLEKVRAYAMSKPDAIEKQNKMSLNVKTAGKSIVKFRIRHGAAVASYNLENDLLKDFRRGSGTSSIIRHKETEVVLSDGVAAETACNMVDLMMKQFEKERELAKERRREARKARSAEENEGKRE